MSTAFLLTSLVVVATPGTGAVYSISIGLVGGTHAGIIAAGGCTLGVLPHMIAAITGLAAIMNTSATAFSVVRWLGVAYLLFLAWRALRDTSLVGADIEASRTVPRAHRIVTTAVLINLLNPKLTIFFLAFLPQFVPAGAARPAGSMAILSAMFMVVTFAVFAAYGAAAATMRDRVLTRPAVLRWLRRTFFGTYVLLAGRLASETRT